MKKARSKDLTRKKTIFVVECYGLLLVTPHNQHDRPIPIPDADIECDHFR